LSHSLTARLSRRLTWSEASRVTGRATPIRRDMAPT
jgi:hypothetical protein